MTKHTVLALAALMPPEMERLEQRYEVVRLQKGKDPETVIQEVKGRVEAIISTIGTPVRRPLIEACPHLKIIAQHAVGVDNIDLLAANEHGVAVTNTPDVVTDDTADIALALILAVSRRIVEGDMYVRVGKWRERSMPLGTSPKGKTVGIVGLGRIGMAIARRLIALDMKIVYHNRHRRADVPYKYYENLESMAKDCDYLVLSCPGGADTRHLVGERVLAALGPKGFLINVARGSVVDEGALVTALANKWIAGAGLDVYENEPVVPDALLGLDNVVLLPHIGTATIETRTICSEIVTANIDALFTGKPLLTPVVID